MSLVFSDEHLAWQQRITKEKFSALHYPIKLSGITQGLSPALIRYENSPATPIRPSYISPHKMPAERCKSPRKIQAPYSITPRKQGHLSNPKHLLSTFNEELHGKPLRVKRHQQILPTINSRNSTTGYSGFSSALSGFEGSIYDIEGKSIDEIRLMLKQERIRRIMAEKRLKEFESVDKKETE